MYKNLLRIFASCFILFLACFILMKKVFITDKFSSKKIIFSKNFTDPKLSFDRDSILAKNVLDRPFRYLSKGRQCFVFESEDQKYVLKFLRYDRVSTPISLRILASRESFKNKTDSKKNTFFNWIQSYKIAIGHLPCETSIIFAKLHFGKTLVESITLVDSKNRKIEIDVNHCLFFIQKKVTPLDEILLNLKKQKNTDQIHQILDTFLDTVARRLNQNIENKTTSCYRNVGWLDGEIIEFDIGDLVIYEHLNRNDVFERCFIYFTRSLRKWLDQEIPEMVEYMDSKQNEIFVKNRGS